MSDTLPAAAVPFLSLEQLASLSRCNPATPGVLAHLLSAAGEDGIVDLPAHEIIRRTKVQQATLTKSIASLERVGVIRRLTRPPAPLRIQIVPGF